MNKVAVVAAGAACLLAADADACRCVEPSPRQAASRAEAIVLGRIESARDLDQVRTVLDVVVDRSWKRAFRKELAVETGTTCRLPARAGQRYLLFLRTDGSGHYYTAQCMGDRLDPSAEVLAALGASAP